MEQVHAASATAASNRRASLLAMSPERCIIVHRGSPRLQTVAQVARIHGTHIELMGKLNFGSRHGDHVEMAALSNNQFLVAYSDGSQRDTCYMMLGSLWDDMLQSFTPPLMMEPSGCSSLSVAALSPSSAVVAFNSNTASSRGAPVVLVAEVKGQLITLSEKTEVGERLDGFVTVPLSSSRFLLVYRNLRLQAAAARVGRVVAAAAPDDGDGGRDEDGDAAGLQAAVGDEVPLPTTGRTLTYLSAARMSLARAVVVFADAAEGHVVLVDAAGDSLTPHTPAPFSSEKPLSVSLSVLSDDSFVIGFYTGDPWRAKVVKGAVLSSGHVALVESRLPVEQPKNTHMVALSSHSFLATYHEGSNSGAGAAVVGAFPRGFGIASSSGEEGETVGVRLGGISSSHMSLRTGECYYAGADGSLTTSATGQRVGLAVSANDVLMGSC
uniref:Uncharacterized protein n=1 Tax=Tetraselmis sp. GSL018 TaxID=582737 RepID=A0A061RGX0_9CHLO